jgi:deoxyribodipyrimidine photo-lyase
LEHRAELLIWARKVLSLSAETGPAYLIKSSHSEALATLDSFIRDKLKDYSTLRNHPNLDVQSHMSPYLHFGQISPLQIIHQICETCDVDMASIPELINGKAGLDGMAQSIGAFAEELIVRRELAMNFCHYNPDYKNSSALPDWAIRTLNDHLADAREGDYSLERLELAESSDIYWNAAQRELLMTGKMHNYMRMYWGKRVLAWCPSVEEAYQILAYLNNKYELDGRDPNAWAGIAWCFGKHDRPWAPRPIYGMVRYMNSAGLQRKFDMKAYIQKWN